MQISDLPAVNAILNSTSALLLLAGFYFIRQGQVARHRLCMLGAVSVSILFLTSYLIYHYHIGSKPFEGEGGIRTVYFTILISHTILAMAIVPMAALTLWRAFQRRFDRHRRIARWTLPIWLYVSVTGVVVYWMLYRM
ncbi:MAG TPA: DUF420 domain-containing protein [Acidobacteriota bacterium]|nr:DUF420 domain-containing protein [Acidobacteriota bacterium]